MNHNEIIEFVTQNPVCTLATVENDQPHVRGFLTNIIDHKIYFTTSTYKRVGRELLQNQKVELCYLNADSSVMLRITANVAFEKSLEMKQKLIDEKPYLKGFSADDETFLLFTLENAKARFWGLADNMKEEGLEVLAF
jgi:uncharacterized pyridoxamine 5'-phosphate oxidase family protein